MSRKEKEKGESCPLLEPGDDAMTWKCQPGINAEYTHRNLGKGVIDGQ